MAPTVIEALRRFLPQFLHGHPPLNAAQRRAVWAITHCRTPTMGGHLHVCAPCGTREFRFHSCNHRACPQCGRAATVDWVQRELTRRVGAPYFMVTFTLPAELRPLFFTQSAREIYALFFDAAAHALRLTLARPRWLGAATSGFTLVLHTWNQRLFFHPHLHAIVPGAGLHDDGRVVSVPSPTFLAPKAQVRKAFRARFRAGLQALRGHHDLPPIDLRVWQRDWGVKLQPFGDGQSAIKYLGAYVARTAIGDSRIRSLTPTHVAFSWKDRAHGDVLRTETVTGVEFVRRYLRHVLPRGLKAVRHYGFCHPAAKLKRERVAFHTGRPLLVGAAAEPPTPLPPPSAGVPTCPCCGQPMKCVLRVPPAWRSPRGPPATPIRAIAA
jgi:Putative transposase/Transposase zinc-binding domain